MRWACLLLPHLAIDAALRQLPEPEVPLALISGPVQRRVLHAVSPAARRLGLRRGMRLSAAQALGAAFVSQPHDPRLDQQAFTLLASWAYGFSSQVCTGFAHALVLEIGASRALFGQWPELEHRLRSELTMLGFRHRLVAAPNPHAAHVLAHVHDGLGVDEAQLERVLGQVPIERSGLPAAAVDTLARSGLRTLRPVFALARESLTRRFPPEVLAHLDAIRGRESAPLACFQPPDRFAARIEFEYEVESSTALLFPLRRLTADLAAFLCSRDGGVQRFVLRFEHERHPDSELVVGLLAPEREATVLFDLARSRLDHLQLPAGTRGMSLLAEELPPFVPVARDLFDTRPQQAMDWEQLRERLRARLGDEAVQPLGVHADHRPERASAASTKSTLPPRLPLRPAWLLPQPIPLRGFGMQVLTGPERIESGWWDGEPVRRDYYVLRTRDGQRAWAFTAPGERGPFMLHGWFA
jgi:protein ImuB